MTNQLYFTDDTIVDSDYDCTQNVLALVNNGTRKCNCPVSCHEVDFTTSMSISTWPSNQYWVGRSQKALLSQLEIHQLKN